ncbi:hypothetical protein GCM10010211_20560 [Streptomyces albospinus]|uniref:Uncharacterized protein n=1 Tax=Streptomyces albospinus TaxID=285515 RepID=A0ABQ2UV89_9ACTN|nr:hypothetical protein [Streptomyces albospinus]GGU55673.1 hypothetical protein GCM10010211_20560 [Streptomyces albospinus]
MGNDLVGKRWDAACAKARESRPWPRDEQDALALVYYLIATHESVEVEGISTQSVRYRIDNPFVLQQQLTELIPGPRSGPSLDAAAAMAERTRTRLAEAEADANESSGQHPVEGRIRHVWNSMQGVHFEDREDSLMSDEVGITLAEGHRWRDTGVNLFEQAVGKLRASLDRELLSAGGHPSLGATVEVTDGVHVGRTGSVSAVSWQADHERHTIEPAPESFTVRFSDLYESIDIAAADVTALPEWDRNFVVVHAGGPFPTEWSASVLLADADEKSLWRQTVLDALRDGWTGFGRLVVFVPRQGDGSQMAAEHHDWVSRAASCADEIIVRCLPGVSAPLQRGLLADIPTAAVCGRLVVMVPGGEPNQLLSRWLEQHAAPVAGGAAEAASIALKRIERGSERKGGERDVPLLAARTTGYFWWSSALRDAGRALISAEMEWVHSNEDTGHEALWWSMRARIRHADYHVTSELLLCHPMMTSVVAYRRREKWTDCEIVLVPCDNSLSNIPVREAPKGLALRLPTILTDFSGGSDHRERSRRTLHELFDIDGIDMDRLRTLGGRNDSSLVAANRNVTVLELTEDELASLLGRDDGATDGPAGPPLVICRVADLLAEPVCDWATLGAITRAVMPTWPPASGDFYTGRM